MMETWGEPEGEGLAEGRLEEIEARLAAATPGPWSWQQEGEIQSTPLLREYQRQEDLLPKDAPDSAYDALPDYHVASVPYTQQGFKDMDLIAHAPADLRDLLAEVRRFRLKAQERL